MALSFLPAMSKDEQVGVMGNALCSKLWEVRAAAIRLITSQPEADLRWMQKKALQGIRRAMGCESDKMAMDAFGLAFQQPKETHLGLLASALRRGKSEKMLIAAIAKVSEMDMPEKSRKKLCKLACHAVIRQENGLFRTTLNKDDLREATARMPHEYRKRIMGG